MKIFFWWFKRIVFCLLKKIKDNYSYDDLYFVIFWIEGVYGNVKIKKKVLLNIFNLFLDILLLILKRFGKFMGMCICRLKGRIWCIEYIFFFV